MCSPACNAFQVRYIVETMPIMLESGTKTLSLPSELYGCPYPPNPALPPGTCAAPDLCNCNAGICFGTCKGGCSCKPSHLTLISHALGLAFLMAAKSVHCRGKAAVSFSFYSQHLRACTEKCSS